MKKIIFIAMLVICTSAAYAEDMNVKPGILPGNPFWALDIWWDNLNCNIFTIDEEKAVCKSNVMDERLAEMAVMKQNTEYYNMAYGQYRKVSEELKEEIKFMKTHRIKQMVMIRLQNHIQMMEQQLSEEQKEQIRTRLEGLRKQIEEKRSQEETDCEGNEGEYYDGVNTCMPCPEGSMCIAVCSPGCVMGAPHKPDCNYNFSKACVSQYTPVCCDGMTYPNKCVAESRCAVNCISGACNIKPEPIQSPEYQCEDGTPIGECSTDGRICQQVVCIKAPCPPLLLRNEDCAEGKTPYPDLKPNSECNTDEMCQQKYRHCSMECEMVSISGFKYGICKIVGERGNYPGCDSRLNKFRGG